MISRRMSSDVELQLHLEVASEENGAEGTKPRDEADTQEAAKVSKEKIEEVEKVPEVDAETVSEGHEVSIENIENESDIRNKELKSLLQLSKEANLDTNIRHKRNTATPEHKRSTRSLNSDPDEGGGGGAISSRKRNRDSSSESSTGGATERKGSKLKSAMELVQKNKDGFCWRCHRDGVTVSCGSCPRSYHAKCLKNASVDEHWICPECCGILTAESAKTKPAALKSMPLGHLCKLLKFALKRMVHVENSEPFVSPVDEDDVPDYRKYIVYPMDFTKLEKNIKANAYGSTKAFEADAKWLLHNSIVFNSYQSKLTTVAKSIIKICKQEMAEIENCSNCYLNANTKKTWFVEVCPKPHLLVWAKLKGFPYWPAKVMCMNNSGLVDVRFFGAHDRAWVAGKDCFLYSLKDPNLNHYKRDEISECTSEVDIYIQNLKSVYGKVNHQPYRTPFYPDKMHEHLRALLPEYDSHDSPRADSKSPGRGGTTTAPPSQTGAKDAAPGSEGEEDDWEVQKYIDEAKSSEFESPPDQQQQRPGGRGRPRKTPVHHRRSRGGGAKQAKDAKDAKEGKEAREAKESRSSSIHSSRSDSSATLEGETAAAVTRDMLVLPSGKLKMADKLMKKLSGACGEGEDADSGAVKALSEEGGKVAEDRDKGKLSDDGLKSREEEDDDEEEIGSPQLPKRTYKNLLRKSSDSQPDIIDIKQVILGSTSSKEESSGNISDDDSVEIKSPDRKPSDENIKTIKFKSRDEILPLKEKLDSSSENEKDKKAVEITKVQKPKSSGHKQSAPKRHPTYGPTAEVTLTKTNKKPNKKDAGKNLDSKRKPRANPPSAARKSSEIDDSVTEEESLLEEMYFEVVEEHGRPPPTEKSVNGQAKRKRDSVASEDDESPIHSKLVKLVDIDLIKNPKLHPLDLPLPQVTIQKPKSPYPNPLGELVEVKCEVESDDSMGDDYTDSPLSVTEKNSSGGDGKVIAAKNSNQKPQMSLLKVQKPQLVPTSSEGTNTTAAAKIVTPSGIDSAGMVVLAQPTKAFVNNPIVLPPNQSITYGGNSIFVQHPHFANYLIPTSALNVGAISIPISTAKGTQNDSPTTTVQLKVAQASATSKSIAFTTTPTLAMISKPNVNLQAKPVVLNSGVQKTNLTTINTPQPKVTTMVSKQSKQLPPLRKGQVCVSPLTPNNNPSATSTSSTSSGSSSSVPPPLCSFMATAASSVASQVMSASGAAAGGVAANQATGGAAAAAKLDGLEDYDFLTGHVPARLVKALGQLMAQPPPALKSKPGAAGGGGPLSAAGVGGQLERGAAAPSSAGPVAAKVNAIAYKLTDYFRGLLTDFLAEFGSSDNHEAEIAALRLEVETLRQQHGVEAFNMRKNLQMILREMQKNFAEERQRIVEDAARAHEEETIRRVAEAKSKQWCANCAKEAQFYCCWNTSYCDYPCQTEHWPAHMDKCTQQANSSGGSAGASKAEGGADGGGGGGGGGGKGGGNGGSKQGVAKKTVVAKFVSGNTTHSTGKPPKVYSSPKMAGSNKIAFSSIKVTPASNVTSKTTTPNKQSTNGEQTAKKSKVQSVKVNASAGGTTKVSTTPAKQGTDIISDTE